MNSDYWNLFWTTGMPEAWLMSRDRERLPASGANQNGMQGLFGPDGPSPVPGHIPGSPKNLC